MASEQDFMDYIAGASLAFGTVILTFQIIGMFYASSDTKVGLGNPVIFAAYLLPHIMGGTLAAYLVTRRRNSEILRAGIITVIVAYALESIYYLIFGNVLSDIWSLIGLLAGGFLGSIISGMMR